MTREIDAFASRKARSDAKKAAAAERKVSIRTINRLKILDKPLESVRNRIEKAQRNRYKREILSLCVESVLSGEITASQAASQCSLSERQLYRYLARAKQGVK